MTTTLVFGASLNASRYSNLAIRRLVENNQETLAFGMREGTVAGVQVKTNLDEFQNIDTITLYMNPTRQKEFYQSIIDLNPSRVIFNPGTENHEFAEKLKKHGILVEEACTLVLLSIGQY